MRSLECVRFDPRIPCWELRDNFTDTLVARATRVHGKWSWTWDADNMATIVTRRNRAYLDNVVQTLLGLVALNLDERTSSIPLDPTKM